MTVELQPRALQAAGVGVGEVVGALQAQNLAAPVGRLTAVWTSARSGCAAVSTRRTTSRRLVVAQRNGRLDPARRRGDRERRHRGAAHGGAVQRPRSRRHRHHEGRRATARPTVADASAREIDEIRKTLPPGVELRDRARRRAARRQLGRQRAGRAGRRRAAHRARRVPVPQLVALDGHHRPGAAGVGASRRSSPCWRSASR